MMRKLVESIHGLLSSGDVLEIFLKHLTWGLMWRKK
jgi:hypothetical protein